MHANSDFAREREDKWMPTGGVLVARRGLCGPEDDKVNWQKPDWLDTIKVL